jgi:tetratricopeptide (TPR) repeat protein
MNTDLTKVLLGTALAMMLPCIAAAQSQGPRTPPTNAMDPNSIGDSVTGGGSATLMIYLRDEYGAAPASAPIFTVDSLTFNSSNPAPPRPFEGGWVLTGLRPRDEYDIEVSVVGYKVAHKYVIMPDLPPGAAGGAVSTTVIIYLQPENGSGDSLAPMDGTILAPRAEKEVQHALKDLNANNLKSAEKHAGKAVEMAPGNPYVNYLMGMCYLRMNELPKAKASLEKSVSLDPKRAPALLALGMLRYREGDYPGAIQLLEQATQLDASAWKAEWMLASCYLHASNYAKARESAEKAIKVGKISATPVQLLLGEALAGLNQREGAIEAFEAYLKAYPKYPAAAQIRDWISILKQPPTVAQPSAAASAAGGSATAPKPTNRTVAALSAGLPLPAVELPPKNNWAPPDIDSVHPPVASGASCPLPEIMQAAGKSAVDLVTDIQKFSAIEDSQSVEIKRDEQLETPVTRRFNYLVLINDSRPHLPEVTEYRTQISGPPEPTGYMEDGAPVLALAFHPDFRNDFAWTCEGLGEWNNQPTWLVHFEQRPDRPISRLRAVELSNAEYALPLKGRAWISKTGGHILHLETDLVRPINAIDLKREHFSVDYEPVSFRSHHVSLWLPQNVDVYLQYQGHFLHHYHRYTDFTLFWVGSTQKIEEPKEADQKP